MAENHSAIESPKVRDLDLAAPLLEELPGAFLLLDSRGTVEFMNRDAEERIGRRRTDVIGRDFFRDVLPHLEEASLGERYREVIRDHPVTIALEAALPGPTGERRVNLGIRSFEGPQGRSGLLLIEDRSELASETARRRHAERLAAVGELAAGVAHEINNPLASIKGFAQLLARETLDLGQQQALEIISQECSRVARIVDNLLEFAQQQRISGPEGVNLSAIAESALSLKRYSLETSGIEIDADFDAGLSNVVAEKGALQRLVLILLNHAERALLRREGGRRLSLRTRESVDGVGLYIGDNGPGISRDRLRKLLQIQDDPEGGLCLATAALIARENRGSLWVESAEGKGTTFSLRLGCLETSAEPPRSEPTAPERRGRAVPAPARVLIADDEPTLRLALSMFLGRHGYEVEQAEDADQAYRMATNGTFDVVLLDVRMPGDGLVLLDRLDAVPAWKGRSILMTGDHTQSRVREEIRAGRPHLTKPFDMMDVVRLIEQVKAEAEVPSELRLGSWTSS